ncbi:MAG: hypothetical protein R3350_02460 [Saprospiraceae bacterium]|nr:hypothetical protein [Saprospiraceae bacterium]
MQKNNFKTIEAEDERRYFQHHTEKVRSGVWSTLGSMRLAGDLLTMFVPRVLNVIVSASGGGMPGREDPASAVSRGESSEAPKEDHGGPDKPESLK